MFQRDANFKIPLSKTFEIKGSDDVLATNPKIFLEKKKFRADYLSMQSVERTLAIYKIAGGQNVIATFERLRREIEDLQYLGVYKQRTGASPIVWFDASENDRAGHGSISFMVNGKKKGYRVKLSQNNRPPSTLGSHIHMGQYIKLEVNAKVAEPVRLQDIFCRSLLSGELFIDFLIEKLIPELEKGENVTTQISNTFRRPPGSAPSVGRTMPGQYFRNRGPPPASMNFRQPAGSGRDNHGGGNRSGAPRNQRRNWRDVN
uniref:Uncharacterized protein n=1 Tax=Caenorhabditis japonica TaxID=281687 RepID=A0A8R1HS35_CAEJA